MSGWISPQEIFLEYENGQRYKNALGDHGLYEQNRINRRFMAGDQWSGVNSGAKRPLVRHNLIRRVADYKLSVVGGDTIGIAFSAEGSAMPHDDTQVRAARADLAKGRQVTLTREVQRRLVMSALGDYFRVTAQRTCFEQQRLQVLRKAYLTGTGFLYTYWDADVRTGLFDNGRPVQGDIACEVLDVEHVYLGDPSQSDVQKQPYLLIAQRQDAEELRAQARRFGGYPAGIRPDGDDTDPFERGKATVLTRLWKETDDNGEVTVRAVRVCRGGIVRPAWDIGVRMYPIAKFDWDIQDGCGYGASEIPWLIPNQIAINRLLTASTWGMLAAGMPLMLVNGDLLTGKITNDPGQILQVFGGKEEMEAAVRYVAPPTFAPQFESNIEALIVQTLTQAGASAAALGDVDPDNFSAIRELRKAAADALTLVKARYYGFCEQVARIWAEFWVTQYGCRPLKIEDTTGVWYLPFDGAQWRNVLLGIRVIVGEHTDEMTAQRVAVLDDLLERGLITATEYLERLPHGYVPGGRVTEGEGVRRLGTDSDTAGSSGDDAGDADDRNADS